MSENPDNRSPLADLLAKVSSEEFRAGLETHLSRDRPKRVRSDAETAVDAFIAATTTLAALFEAGRLIVAPLEHDDSAQWTVAVAEQACETIRELLPGILGCHKVASEARR